MTAGADAAIQTAGAITKRSELATDLYGLRAQVPPGSTVRLSTNDAGIIAAAISALDGWVGEVQLLPPGVLFDVPSPGLVLLNPVRSETATALAHCADHETRWVLFTSGTTGKPKAISHTLRSLSRTVTTDGRHSFVWGLLYDPNRMAGLQVLLQALRGGGSLVAPPLHSSLPERIGQLAEQGVTALSATPTLWRQILQLPVSAKLRLEQITLGGEIADQRILDALGNAYPDARIVHVFASTETGAAFSVKDRREGFPISYLDDAPRGIRLEIRDNILHVLSPGVSAAGPDGFASTGDVVEVVDDRIVFRGRASGVVNIGGSNVWPEVVESILRSHPEVIEAVVTARPNPMTGHVLVADVALEPEADPDGATKRLRSWVRERAPRTHVPASVTVRDDIAVSSTGKVAR